MEIIYVPLERYENRYTKHLRDWMERAFKTFNASVKVIEGPNNDSTQTGGHVLNWGRRATWGLHQSAQLIRYLDELRLLGERPFPAIYFDDMYHPGLDAVAYYCANHAIYPQLVGAFCWAQTVDRHDFTRRISWMRDYEELWLSAFPHFRIFVATEYQMDLLAAAFPHCPEEAFVCVNGLAYGPQPHLHAEPEGPWDARYALGFCSRWAPEKNPHVFLGTAERVHASTGMKSIVLTGDSLDTLCAQGFPQKYLNDNSPVHVMAKLTKDQYLTALATRVGVYFNCSSQDWVAYTLLDALSCGATPLVPRTKAFPAVMRHKSRFLYDLNAPVGDVASQAISLLSLDENDVMALSELRNELCPSGQINGSAIKIALTMIEE